LELRLDKGGVMILANGRNLQWFLGNMNRIFGTVIRMLDQILHEGGVLRYFVGLKVW
jgi:hypothetical protein